MEIYVKKIFVSTFSLLLILNQDFIISTDFTHIAASHTDIDIGGHSSPRNKSGLGGHMFMKNANMPIALLSSV